MSKTRITNEFTIIPLSKIDSNVSTIIKRSKKAWNEVVVGQLARKLSVARQQVNSDRHSNPIKVEAHFQNGSVAVFVFISEDYSLFEAHEVIRDAFETSIIRSKNISFNLHFLEDDKPWSQSDMIDALSSLVVLSHWSPPNYKSLKSAKTEKTHYGFYTDVDANATASIIKEAELKANATNNTRTLAMIPANKLGSKEFVSYAEAVARRTKAKFRFLNFEQLKELGAGAFCAVLQASKSDGGIFVLERAGITNDVVLVGKGIMFDTGGLDLKTESSMLGMHRDMTGAAVALSSFESLAKLNPDLSLYCYLAIGENLLSVDSYKPGDVIETLSGKTMEIENTDAEGRLLLIDTLTLVDRERSQDETVIIDFATLTGAALDVVGNKRAVVTTNHDYLWSHIMRSGKKSGERVVVLPIDDEFQESIHDSQIADLGQCTGYPAEHCHAGALLSHFISEEKTHVHVDLCCESNEGGLGLVSSKVTGFGVRWLFEFILRSLRIQ